MHKAIATAIILIYLASTAEAEEAALRGNGVDTCGQFGEAYGKNTLSEFDYFRWAQGWMSGVNMALLGVARVGASTDLAAISIEDQLAHIRDFCSDNPLKRYLDAIINLFDSMREAQGLQDWRETLRSP